MELVTAVDTAVNEAQPVLSFKDILSLLFNPNIKSLKVNLSIYKLHKMTQHTLMPLYEPLLFFTLFITMALSRLCYTCKQIHMNERCWCIIPNMWQLHVVSLKALHGKLF